MHEENKSAVKISSNNQTVSTHLEGMDTPEHTKVYSRTLCRDIEIGVGMHGGNLVPASEKK